MIQGVLFDFGETLVERVSDAVRPLNQLALTPFPESVTVLAQLNRSGYRLALVSNTSQSNEGVLREALHTLAMRCYFDAIVTSVDVGCEKPNPAIFVRALERLGCSPAEVVMVGDDLARDIQGAANLGIITIYVRRNGATSPAPDAAARFTVSSLSEIPGILEQLAASRKET